VDLVLDNALNDDWQWGYNGVPFLYSDKRWQSSDTKPGAVGGHHRIKLQT
jgi:hypothetical protein